MYDFQVGPVEHDVTCFLTISNLNLHYFDIWSLFYINCAFLKLTPPRNIYISLIFKRNSLIFQCTFSPQNIENVSFLKVDYHYTISCINKIILPILLEQVSLANPK